MTDNIQATDSTQFAPQQNIPGASSIGPAIVSFQGVVFAAWRGSDDDTGVYWSRFDATGWQPQQRISSVGTGYMPSLAVLSSTLYMAWRGSDDDNGIYFCNYDGSGWTSQQAIPGVSTAFGPSLAAYEDQLYAAWRGSDDDDGIYWATFDGSAWSAQQSISNVATAIGPALAVHNRRLYAAWRGGDTDNGIYYSTYDASGWANQNRIPGVATAVGPSLASFNHRLYVTWRGIDQDNGIYWCTSDGMDRWTAQRSVAGVGTENRPVLAANGALLMMAWKGANEDEGLYWTCGWCGSVQAIWRQGTDASTGAPFARTDLYTMSLATTAHITDSNNSGTGPYQTWSPSEDGSADWYAFRNDWNSLGDTSFRAIGTNPTLPVTVFSPAASSSLIFYVNMTNLVVTINEHSSAYDETGDADRQSIASGYPSLFQPGAPVCAAARTLTELHLFVVGYNGRVFTMDTELASPQALPVWGNAWRELAPLGATVEFLPSTPVAALTRDMSSVSVGSAVHAKVLRRPIRSLSPVQPFGDGFHLDVFAVDSNGDVQTAAWQRGQWPLATQWKNLGGGFPAGAPVSAIARSPENMDLFVIGNDGHVYTKGWTRSDGWSANWQYIGAYFPVGNTVLAMSGTIDEMDLYSVGFDGRVYACNWSGFRGWSGIQQNWQQIGGFFPRNAVLSGVHRSPGARDLFIIDDSGRACTSRLIAGFDWTGSQNNWIPVVVESAVYTQQFLAPKGTALGTTVTLTLYASGAYRYECLTDNTGVAGYDFASKAFYRANSGEVLMLIHSGHVGGALSSGPAQDDYIEHGFHPYIHALWDQVKTGTLFISEEFELTGVLGVVDKIFSFILDLGAYAVGASIGVVLAISTEAANLLGNFSLGELIGIVAGTAILAFGGTAVLAVVAGYAAGKITQALIEQVELDAKELAFAKGAVFGDFSLPADINLYKTNLSTPSGRAFTFPAGGRIYLNLGQDAVNDPVHYQNDGAYPEPGELFIHEMTHAWQIQQSTFLAGQICSGIVIQAQFLTGESVYAYPLPGQPWHEFGVEQQGALVDQWFAGIPVLGAPIRTPGTSAGTEDPYYRYIRDNILLSVTT